MIHKSNTVSPMTVLLPGEPVSHSHANAAAHLSTIKAAWNLMHLKERHILFDQADMDLDMISLIGELSWNVDDGADALRDAIEQYLQDMPLSVEQFARKSHWREDWQLTHYEVLLTTGGPACRFWYDGDCVKMQHQDWGTPWSDLPLTVDEVHPLEWFAAILGLEA